MGVEIKKVEEDENGMRLDRWFKVHYPGLAFGYLQKLLRSGQIRVDGRRVKTDIRLIIGQSIRVPFLSSDNKRDLSATGKTIHDQDKLNILEKMLLYKDPKSLY
ncbi:23S rRNA pseudouridine 955/2504/2580 synthase [Bartonella sp. WD16.2]|nr:23S rRNA pseudouridine 955/2504/2580 synthase [Bartonella sp. WD16.2]